MATRIAGRPSRLARARRRLPGRLARARRLVPARLRLPGRLARARRWLPGRLLLIATWLVVATGAALRIRQWAFDRAFWLDELLLQRAMAQQRFSQLLEPLQLAQSAPPGWLAVQHVLLGLFPDERGARLLPLLSGIGTVVLTALLARTLLGEVAALAATTLVALSTPLITYSAEFKQYSADGFWMLLVLLLGVRLGQDAGRRDRDWYVLGAVSGVGVWFSHATALAVAGVFLALGGQVLAGRRWRQLALLAGCAVPAAAGVAVEYVTVLSANASDAVLQAYWIRSFPPEGPLTWTVGWDWFTGRVRSVVANPLLWDFGRPLAVLAGTGFVVLLLRRPRAVPVLLLPVLAIVAAGLAGSYPISNRLALWAVPLVALLVAAPLDLPVLAARLPRLPRVGRVPAVALAVALALVAAGRLVDMSGRQVDTDARYAAEPRRSEESRTLLRRVVAELLPGDLVLIGSAGGRYAADYYGPQVGLRAYDVLDYERPGTRCQAGWFGARLWQQRSLRRVWLISSHRKSSPVYIDQLQRFGPVAAHLQEPGADAIRFDRAARPPAARTPPHYCVLTASPGGPVRPRP
jgi:Dolichyl-phosphate-mannose-protein mannosyltransferase